jgi:hypothetical protein
MVIGAVLVPRDFRAESSAGEIGRAGALVFAAVLAAAGLAAALFAAELLEAVGFFTGDCASSRPLALHTKSAAQITALMPSLLIPLVTLSSQR